jgi:hypothetical protein
MDLSQNIQQTFAVLQAVNWKTITKPEMEKLAQDLNLDQIAHEKKEQLRQRLQERYQSARTALQLFSPNSRLPVADSPKPKTAWAQPDNMPPVQLFAEPAAPIVKKPADIAVTPDTKKPTSTLPLSMVTTLPVQCYTLVTFSHRRSTSWGGRMSQLCFL